MNKQTAQNLIDKTRDDYNLIAHHFASTRKYNWPSLKKLLSEIKSADNFKIADLGCGSGRIYELIDNKVNYFGIDLSDKLIEIAKTKYPTGNFAVGNILKTPYKNDSFDLTLSVATLHHLPGKASRREALNEVFRITKPGGKIIITNWYFWNEPKYLKEIVKESVRITAGRSRLDYGDFLMPWKSVHKNIMTKRYFHAWTKKETINELQKAGFTAIKILSSAEKRVDGKKDPNLIAIAIKPDK